MKKTKITHVIVVCIFSCSLFFCAQNATNVTVALNNGEVVDTTENTAESNIITFVDPVIESATREILEMPTGDITKEIVLEITRLNLDGYEGIESLKDLKWFENLEILSVDRCNINSLDGIQTLYSLQKLSFSWNQVTNLEPVRDLTNVTELSFAGNQIDDYSPLKELTNIEFLNISDNGAQSTDLSFLSTMPRLETLYAHSCGVSDISVLSSLPNLLILDLDDNCISDISALENLEDLRVLGLNKNLISDIAPLKSHEFWLLDLHNNPIPEEDWMAFFYPIEENHTVTTIHDRINENMSEFEFKISSYLNPEYNAYEVYSIEISDSEEVLQNISVAEFALRDQTCIPAEEKEALLFSLEDFNFDGYLDIRVYDRDNGNLGEEWLHFVWNPDIYQFEHDERFDDIPTPTFDQNEHLIYGERHGDFKHFYYTYQYVDDEIVQIMSKERYALFRSDTQIENYLSLAKVETDAINYWFVLEVVYEYDFTTREYTTAVEDYIIYSADEKGNSINELVRITVTSELGQFITEDKGTTIY